MCRINPRVDFAFKKPVVSGDKRYYENSIKIYRQIMKLVLLCNLIIIFFTTVSIFSLDQSAKYYKKQNEKSWNTVSSDSKNQYIQRQKKRLQSIPNIENDSAIYPDKGMVPNEETAIKLAEIYWLNMYGNSIYFTLPFVAVNVNDSIWRVSGTLPPTALGEPWMISIDKKTGKVLGCF